QNHLGELRAQHKIPNLVLVGEHPHVITLGRGTHPENILDVPGHYPRVETSRGGDVTYHGPGQWMIYPVLYLPPGQRDLHAYLRQLEEVLIQTLKCIGIEGYRNPGWTGVWVRDHENRTDKKIASIGVSVKRWVTGQGIGFNVSTDLSQFKTLQPCGLEATVMTSVEEYLKRQAAFAHCSAEENSHFEESLKNALFDSLNQVLKEEWSCHPWENLLSLC
ncbi:MAG: lipoyl(octanoyl) transferase LipB, partial [Cyanobacteria bacterium]|nr:lipoyl(octanoyl) transferase LipB [Cyanobacteriota bacterium]